MSKAAAGMAASKQETLFLPVYGKNKNRKQVQNNRNRKHITENEQKKVDIEKAKSKKHMKFATGGKSV